MRQFFTLIVTFFVLACWANFRLTQTNGERLKTPGEIVDIGGRLELLVDDFLIDSLQGEVRLKQHRPERKEIVFRTDAPWEGNASAYQSVFQDGDLYRMYYRGMHYRDHPHESGSAAKALAPHAHYLCYAESDDGIHWRRPKLGLYDFNGSKANNIVLHPDTPGNNCSPPQTAVFLDDNPDCPPDERIKIIGQGDLRGNGLYVMKSSDGVRFSPLSPDPIVTEGAFDSQNIAFWDPTLRAYREYHRITLPSGLRGVATATSADLLRFRTLHRARMGGASARVAGIGRATRQVPFSPSLRHRADRGAVYEQPRRSDVQTLAGGVHQARAVNARELGLRRPFRLLGNRGDPLPLEGCTERDQPLRDGRVLGGCLHRRAAVHAADGRLCLGIGVRRRR